MSTTLAATFRRLRARLGITQEQLAELLELSRRTVQRWESGEREPAVAVLPRICGALACTPNELLGFEATVLGPLEPDRVAVATLARTAPIRHVVAAKRVLCLSKS